MSKLVDKIEFLNKEFFEISNYIQEASKHLKQLNAQTEYLVNNHDNLTDSSGNVEFTKIGYHKNITYGTLLKNLPKEHMDIFGFPLGFGSVTETLYQYNQLPLDNTVLFDEVNKELLVYCLPDNKGEDVILDLFNHFPLSLEEKD